MKNIETHCSKCTLFNNNNCDLGRLSTFIDKNKARKTPDGNFIVDTICNTFVDKNIHIKPEHKNALKIRELVKVTFDLLVFIDNDTDVLYLLDKIEELNYVPKNVFLVSKTRVNAIKIIQYAKTKKFNTELKYIFDKNAVDLIVSKSNSDYVCYCSDIDLLPINYFANIDSYINDELESLIMIRPIDEINGFVIYKKAFQLYHGNKDMSIIEKIELAAKNQNNQRIIQDYAKFAYYSNNSQP